MDASTKQFISDASLRLMGMSDRTLNEYIAAIGPSPPFLIPQDCIEPD